MPNKAIPVSLVSGFLGSGKTTLINHVLASDHGMRMVVMVNDFGEINIDSELIVTATQNVLSLANGCICCTLENDLIEQLEQLLSRLPRDFDYLLIETSGVSDPTRVLRTLRYPRFAQRLRTDNVVTLVDAEQLPLLDGEQLQLAQAQLTDANLVVINKADLVGGAALEKLRRQWLFPDTRCYVTQWAQIPMQLLLDADAAAPSPADAPPQAEAVHAEFVHWSWQSARPLQLDKLRRVLATLPTSVYRAKGLLYIDGLDQPVVLNMVGNRHDLQKRGSWDTNPPATRLVMIATRADTDFTNIEEALENALAVPN